MQRAYYFSNEYLVDLFSKCGFTLEEIFVHNKQVENRSLDLVMIFYNASSLAIELIHKSFSCIVILLTLNTGVQEFNREPYSTLQFNI
jgi:hypothetical protein